MFFGRPPTLWWLLIIDGGIVADGHALDDVGIKRALREEFRRAELLRRALEFLDENRGR